MSDSNLEMNKFRSPEFQRNKKLEEVLKEVNNLIENIVSLKRSSPKYPIIFIIGVPRCGSTLFLQWIASLNTFGYPSNLIARFYKSPYLGARIQQILIDYDIDGQIDFNRKIAFKSKLGRSNGALSPSEFWYFWRRFFHFGEIQVLSEKELKNVDYKNFVGNIAGLEAALNKPLAMKAMILNWHLSLLSSLFKHVLFVNIKRNPFFNAQSLLLARKKFFSDINRWYSYKPKEYTFLKKLTPFQQVAGQVYYTKQSIGDGLKKIDPSRYINVDYETFCVNPLKYFKIILKKFEEMGCKLPEKYSGLKSFVNSNKLRLQSKEKDEILGYYKTISGKEIQVINEKK
jgi:hypothetical protein